MSEVLVEFADPIADTDGNSYMARACGAEMPDGMWQGWIEFVPVGDGEPVRSARETTQPNHADTVYWATGLTYVYLEGALRRARNPLVRPAVRESLPPLFDGPAPRLEAAAVPTDSVLNPFSVARKGEALLRRQLSALSAWHLVNIVRDYRLSSAAPDALEGMSAAKLVELINAAVREHPMTVRGQ